MSMIRIGSSTTNMTMRLFAHRERCMHTRSRPKDIARVAQYTVKDPLVAKGLCSRRQERFITLGVVDQDACTASVQARDLITLFHVSYNFLRACKPNMIRPK